MCCLKKGFHKLKNHPTHTILMICSHILLIMLIIYCIYMNLFNAFTPESFTPQNPNTDPVTSEGTVSTDSDISSAVHTLEEKYTAGTRYIRCTIPTMYYSGYDSTNFGKVTGHYYYSLDDTSCTIYLISSKSFNGEIPVIINDYTFTARLSRNDANIKSLLRYMSSDINWNYYSLSQCTGSIVVDASAYSFPSVLVILISLLLLALLNIAQILNMIFRLS